MVRPDRKLNVKAVCQTALILLLINLLVFPPGLIAQTSSSWNGGTGFYDNANNWNPSGVPDNASAGGPFDATINSGGGDDVTLRLGGVNLNSMTIGGSGAGSTVSIASNNLGLTLGTTYNSALNINSDGTLNINSGSSALVLGNNGGGITNNGALNIAGGATLTVQGEFQGAFITNNGVIALGDLSGGGTLVLNDSGRGAPFLLTNDFGSTGVLRMSDNAANQINGVSGSEALFLENGSTISGAGSINVAVSNSGTLLADGTNALIVGNLTNWNGADTITGGIYGASGTLQLSNVGGSSIQTLSGAVVNLGGAGKISGDGTNNALTGLANINDSVLGLSAMSGPVTINPIGGTLTLSSDSNNTATLTTDFSTQATVNGAVHNLANSDYGQAASTLNVMHGSTFTTGAFTNEANVTDNFLPANAVVNVNSGGTLNVGALTTSTNNGYASSTITVDGGTLNASSITQGSGPGLQSGASDIKLTNGSIGTVTGDFNNVSELNATTVTLDNVSHLTVGGAFTQSQPDGSSGQSFLTLDHGSSMNVGSLTNSTGVLSNGVPQSHVSVNNLSTLTVGTFGNVDANGVLTGGDYYVGPASTFNYTGAAITEISAGTSVTLDATGLIRASGNDALNNSLTTNNGSLALLNGANLNLTTLTNVDSNGVLSGGSFEVGNGSTLSYNGPAITSIASSLTLDGTGQVINTPSTGPNALVNSLSSVSGSFTLNSNASLTLSSAAGSFTNLGAVQVLNGSTFDISAVSFNNLNGSSLDYGSFTVAGNSTLHYAGSDITSIGSGASLTLDAGSKLVSTSGSPDAISTSLVSNYGGLTLSGYTLTPPQEFTNYGLMTLAGGNTTIDVGATSRLTNSPFFAATLPGSSTIASHECFECSSGEIDVNDGATFTIKDTSGSGFTKISNSGTIILLGDTAATTLGFDSGGNAQKFLLAGSGTLFMQDSSSSQIANNYITGVSGAESLINGYNHEIEGSGTISNFTSFKNNGLIEADGFQGLTIDLTNGGTFTNDGHGNAVVNVFSSNILQINSNNNTSITNNGVINLFGCGCGAGAAMFLNDNGNGATFTFTGNGSIQMSGSEGNAIIGFYGDESLVNDTNHTIAGAGGILFNNFTNNGTLHAENNGGNALAVLANVTNWDPGTSTLTGGNYIVDDQSTMYLSLGGNPLGGGQRVAGKDDGVPQIQTLSGANVSITGSGLLTGDPAALGFLFGEFFGQPVDALGVLSTIDSGASGAAGLSLTNVGGTNGFDSYVINPASGVLTVSSDDSRGHLTDTATLQLDNSNLILGDPDTGSFSDLVNTASSTTGNNPTSTIGMVNGSGLFVQNLTNNASATGAGTASALITVDGVAQNVSEVNVGVSGDLYNQVSTTGAFTGNATASIFLTNGAAMQVVGSLTNSVTSDSLQGTVSAAISVDNSSLLVNGDFHNITNAANGNAYLSLNNNAYAEVDGVVTNSAGSSIGLDGGSTLNVFGGNLTNGGTVSLYNGSQVSVSGVFDNSGGTLSLNGGESENFVYANGFTNTGGTLNVAAGDTADFRASDGSNSARFSNLVTNKVTGQTELNSGTYYVGGTVNYDGVNGLINKIDSGVSITLDGQQGGAAQILAWTPDGQGGSQAVNALGKLIHNSGYLTLTNGVTLSVDSTGLNPVFGGGTLTNFGSITLGTPPIQTFQHRVGGATDPVVQPNALNVTGNLFNTSDGVINLYGAGDSVNVTGPTGQLRQGETVINGQFMNGGQVNLSGANTAIFANSFDNQAGGTTSFNGTGSSVNTLGAATNEGSMSFNAAGSVVSSSGFTNTGGVHVANGSDVTFEGVDTTDPAPYTQTAGTTTIDSGGQLTASEIDIDGGELTGGGTIAGNVVVDGGTISPGDPQSMSIIGNYTQVLPGVMDLNLDATTGDQILVTGAVNLGGTLELTLAGGADDFAALVSSYKIITWTAGELGNFNNFLIGGQTSQSLSSLTFDHGTESFAESFVSNQDGSGELDLILTSNAAPEPSTLAMIFGAGLLGAGIVWRRRRAGANGIE
jgi:hypothetical protein